MDFHSLLGNFVKGFERDSDIKFKNIGTLVFELGKLVYRSTTSSGNNLVTTFEQREGEFLSKA